MTRKLKDIELQEVSLVDKAANKKKFLFFKQEDKPAKAGSKKLKKKINIVIDSDGTIGGTKIVVNKDEIEDLKDFNFSLWSDGDTSRAVSCSYSKFVETEDGFSRSETYYLSKGDLQMDPKIQKQLQKYFGEEETIDFEKAEENDVIVKSLETVNEYREEFPDDLKKAVGTIAKQAGLYVPAKEEKQEDDKTGIEKAGAKLSKDTLKKIMDALAALKSIIPELKDKTEKKADTSEVEKKIEEISKTIEGLEKKEQEATASEGATKLAKALETLSKRLEVVEKSAGIKKSVDGQEVDGDNKDGDKKWPSLAP